MAAEAEAEDQQRQKEDKKRRTEQEEQEEEDRAALQRAARILDELSPDLASWEQMQQEGLCCAWCGLFAKRTGSQFCLRDSCRVAWFKKVEARTNKGETSE